MHHLRFIFEMLKETLALHIRKSKNRVFKKHLLVILLSI